MVCREERHCFSGAELLAVEGFDNGEPMLDARSELASVVLCGAQRESMVPYVGEAMLLRRGVIERLALASRALEMLRPGAKLKLLYAYRHPEIQSEYFQRYFARVQDENPDLSFEDLRELTHHFIAIPEVAGHPTGAAVDITIFENQSHIDMGGRPGDFEKVESFPVWSPVITEQQLANRLLLRQVMTDAGFAPYDLEWWHFSYGDREWACHYGQKKTLYESVDIRSVLPAA